MVNIYLLSLQAKTKQYNNKNTKIMKKQTNIAALKELVNNNVLENVRLRINGVQAYNIAEGEEYTVIVKYAKQGGRYYFIDREGRRFLASRYDRAEFVAGEMLEVIANESAAATNAADQVEASGSVLVCADLLPLFFEECDRRGFRVTSTAAGIDDLGRMLTRYDLVKDEEPAQQEDSNDESDNNNAQSNDSNDSNETPAEPSRLAKAAAKVKAYARRAAFAVSLAAVVVLCLVVFFVCIPALHMMLQAAGVEGTAGTVLTFCALVPALDITLWLECNALAVLARLFPGSFVCYSRPEFLRPCSILAKMYRNAL